MTLQLAEAPEAIAIHPVIGPTETEMTRQQRSSPPLKRNQIRLEMQDLILHGVWPAGAKLAQEDLAHRFKAAQGLVREILVELRETGLVESADFRGAVVTNLDKNRLLEACELREMHEAIAVRRCCQRMSRAEVRALMNLPERIYRASNAGKSELAALLDREFHETLLARSQGSMLARLAVNYRLLCRAVYDGRKPSVIRNEHLAILRAIEEGRAADAERHVRHHIAHERRWIQRHFDPKRLATVAPNLRLSPCHNPKDKS